MPHQPHAVIPVSDLADGAMRAVEIDSRKILLIRSGDDIVALDATCPHAGGPLHEGVLCGSRVVCPWHKAAFDISSGACLEPPAMDDLVRHAVDLRKGDAHITLADAAPRQPVFSSEKDRRRFVIVGAGAAGANAAITLRDEGFSGRILLIDAPGELPYDRTALSKSVLSGGEQSEKSPLQDAVFYRRHQIERVTGEVASLDPVKQSLTLADATAIAYDSALIATGGAPVRPGFPGAALAGIFVLRSQADAERIVRAAEGRRQVVIVGTGFIGMEAAASLRERGLEVTVVAPDRVPFEKQLGPQIGAVFQRLHESQGVRFKLGRKIERAEGSDSVQRMLLDDGSWLEADLVVAGLGVRPATGFLGNLPRREDGGLEVNARLRVREGLYAAGDIAAFPLRGDGPRIRVEHWRVAEQQGRLAARNMLGADEPYDAVPYFWSLHFMKQLDYVGHASGHDEIVLRGDLEKPQFIAYYLRQGRVAAAAGFEKVQDMAAVLQLMSLRRDWSVDDIHPPGSSPVQVLGDFVP